MAQVTLKHEAEAERMLGALGDDERFEIEDLPGAFALYFQPVFDLHSGEVRSCEALLRWLHPDFGVLRPKAALQATRWAEALAEMERWAVGAACQQAARWSAAGYAVPVDVNVSMRQVRDPGFLAMVAAAVSAAGVDPALIGLDLPFAAFARRPREVAALAAELSRLGVTVIADDVTGDIHRAELDSAELAVYKILLYPTSHRRTSLHPSAVTALELAHEVGAVAVAKAVENSAELEVLRALGFDRAFGHVYRPALPAAEIPALLDGD